MKTNRREFLGAAIFGGIVAGKAVKLVVGDSFTEHGITITVHGNDTHIVDVVRDNDKQNPKAPPFQKAA